MSHSQTIHVEEEHGSRGHYMVGFILSVVLTMAAFGLVIGGVLPSGTALIAISVLAFVQIVVHLVCFLHMGLSSSGKRWDSLAFAYTVLCALFFVVGTIWVMHNVTMNMMAR
jgi:cytochrome o ubiquinol oxidase operon protein cyoD